ncbi:MAG: hypothetical protein Q9186_003299 [Xanthomendoza sp. 1 TL-2023]
MPHASFTIPLLLLVYSLASTALQFGNYDRDRPTHPNIFRRPGRPGRPDIPRRPNLRLPNAQPIQCHRLPTSDPPPPGLQPTTCAQLAESKCDSIPRIQPAQIRRSEWVWNEVEGCALGFYFPPDAPIPTREECNEIFYGLIEECAFQSRWDAGAVNVGEWPDFAQEGTAVEEGENRFILAPWRLTL